MRYLLFFLTLCPAAFGQAWSGILNPSGTSPCSSTTPTACAIDWSTAGIPGGIPSASWTQSGSTITSTGSDQTTAIQTALNACSGNKFVNLAAGTFLVSNVLSIPSGCELRGQGANLTIVNSSATNGNGIVDLGAGANTVPGATNDTAVTGGLSAGSTTITVASAAHIAVGTNLSLSELNSPANGVNPTGSEGFCNFCDVNYNGTRTSGQTVLVTGVSGTSVTITPALYWTYGSTLPSWAATTKYGTAVFITNGGHYYQQTATPTSPYVCTSGGSAPAFSTSGGSVSDGTCTWLDKGVGTTTQPLATPFTPVAVNAGIENLQLYTTNAGTSTLVGPSIIINQCQYCWVHGVEVNYTDADYVYTFFDFGGEISNNYFSNAILHTSGTYDSTIQLSTGVSGMLVQNNIIERSHAGVILEHQTSGNVIAYNYLQGGFDDGSPSVVIGGIDFHGAHPEFNLLEGNVTPQIYEDSIWGTTRNNTAFRNWTQGTSAVSYPETAGRNTVTGGATVSPCSILTVNHTCFPFQAGRAMQVSYLSTGTNLVGNVVGSASLSSNGGYGSGVSTYNSGATVTDALQATTTRIYDTTVYDFTFGYGEAADDGTWPLDSTAAFTTSLIHGNYGNISNAIVYSGSLTHTLPASFYLSSKPSWWTSGMAYPSIGPDVTGASGPGGHVSLTAANPAQNCYLSTMGGSAGGAGSPLTFNAATCYPVSTAKTWYIRTDGGTATQCTGLVNAAYPGSGTGQPCAVNHPFWLLNQSTWTWLVSAGDTVQFEDVGPYYMGQGNHGYGSTWAHCVGDTADCLMPSPPANLKFYGVNKGSCHNAGHTALVNPTQLVGINSVFTIILLQGATAPDYKCFDITQVDTCTVNGVQANTITNTSMTGGVATYSYTYPGSGQYPAVGMPATITGTTNGGGVFNVVGGILLSVTGVGTGSGTFTIGGFTGSVASAADTGVESFTGTCKSGMDTAAVGVRLQYLTAQGPSNATLKDISVHGLRATGIQGSKLNTAPTDVFTASDIYLYGNGESGWDSDGGGCGTNCESQGTMNLSHIRIAWSGGVEVHPNGGTIGGNGVNYVVDQAYGGNGDGAVMLATGGTWNWSDVDLEYNAQDGFDSLHVGDDAAVRPTTTVTRLYSMGNEGQSIKGGGGQFNLSDAIGIANCNVFAVGANFPLNPVGWNALAQQRCRANDAMAFAMRDGDRLSIVNTVNVGEQTVAWDMSTGSCTTNCPAIFKNNTTMGFIGPATGNYPGTFFYGGPNPFTQAGASITNNAWYHMGNTGTTCPGTGSETNYVCTDPLFTSESNVDAMNVMPTSGSPLIGAGVAIPGLTRDFAGNLWSNPPSIGAYEFGGSTPSAPVGLTGTVVLSGNVVLR